jgi:hypothetical protein
MDSLEDHLNREEIRIARVYPPSIPELFLVLNRKDEKWSGYSASLKVDYNEKLKKGRYVPSETIDRAPAMGWDNFAKTVIDLGVLKIGKEIPIGDHPSVSDADLVEVEYVSKGEFRRYFISEPDEPDTPGTYKMAEILKFIAKELGRRDFYSINK